MLSVGDLRSPKRLVFTANQRILLRWKSVIRMAKVFVFPLNVVGNLKPRRYLMTSSRSMQSAYFIKPVAVQVEAIGVAGIHEHLTSYTNEVFCTTGNFSMHLTYFMCSNTLLTSTLMFKIKVLT